MYLLRTVYKKQLRRLIFITLYERYLIRCVYTALHVKKQLRRALYNTLNTVAYRIATC